MIYSERCQGVTHPTSTSLERPFLILMYFQFLQKISLNLYFSETCFPPGPVCFLLGKVALIVVACFSPPLLGGDPHCTGGDNCDDKFEI